MVLLNKWRFEHGRVENEEQLCMAFRGVGTSEIYTEKKYKLGRNIFIKQSAKDLVEKTPSDKSQLMFVQRTISPLWTRQLFEKQQILQKS